jgi:hypothetical protein
MPPLPPTDDKRLWDVWLSHYHFPTLTAADELGLFRLLEPRALSAAEIATGLKLSPRATEALVGTVAALGFLVQYDGRFHLSDVARSFLLPDSPTYWGGMLQFARGLPVTHEALLSALRKDRPRGGTMEGMWEEHEMEPEKARAFTHAMHTRSFHLGVAAARRVREFAGVQRLLDVAGGSGCFSIALAQEHPAIRCTVMELKAVAALAREYIAKEKVQDRVDTVTANMFRDPWPSGYDAAFFSNIYHDWDRPECLLLTKRTFEALPRGGRIFIHELLLSDTKDAPLAGVTDSMVMMLVTAGKQRTLGEFESILSEAGFRDTAVVPTYGYYSVVHARKP